MNNKSLLPILLIILLASLLTYFIVMMPSSSKDNDKLSQRPLYDKEYYVLVAAEDLSIGRKLQKLDLIWQAYPKESVSPEFTVQGTRPIEHFLDMVVRKPISKGSPIIAEDIINPAHRNVLAAIVKPGKRALAIEVNEVTGVAGFVFPGDYVDVMATIGQDDQNQESRTEVIAKGLLVIAIDQTTSRDASDTAKIVKTVTVEVTPTQATKITAAKNQGLVTLSLQGLLES